jgi:predicted negative regulator of RcsB-dependent stress response
MRTVKTAFVSISATLLLAAAPVSYAQSQDDLALMQTFLNIMTDYLHIIDATHAIVSDSERAAIMQMQKIQEVYEERGEKARIAEVLRDVLKNSRNPAIRNAAYIKLGDILKETGRTDEAIQLLREGLNENINAAN